MEGWKREKKESKINYKTKNCKNVVKIIISEIYIEIEIETWTATENVLSHFNQFTWSFSNTLIYFTRTFYRLYSLNSTFSQIGFQGWVVGGR